MSTPLEKLEAAMQIMKEVTDKHDRMMEEKYGPRWFPDAKGKLIGHPEVIQAIRNHSGLTCGALDLPGDIAGLVVVEKPEMGRHSVILDGYIVRSASDLQRFEPGPRRIPPKPATPTDAMEREEAGER